MKLEVLRPLALVALISITAVSALAQETRGRVTGAVTDDAGGVLPGVVVTASGPALIQPQSDTTGSDGTYRFVALPPGVYELTFRLAGFQTMKQEAIRVVTNVTLTVHAQMKVATVEESLTVTGEAPVVDTATTRVGTSFTKELLTEIPNARNIWSSMAEAPGIQMTSYDVGGSLGGSQLGYVTYGVDGQNRTRIEGVDHTEGTSANAGNFDFGSMEEFQIGGAGNLADHDVPGAALNVTVKSGGDRFSGSWYSDYQGSGLISNNVPDELQVPGGRTDDGFFSSVPVQSGNATEKGYDINPNIGGPIRRGSTWFFYSHRRIGLDRRVIGFDQLQTSLSISNSAKITQQIGSRNQIIGFWNGRSKDQPLRDLGPLRPVSAALWQKGRDTTSKVEWTSVLSNRLFLDVLLGHWFNDFPLRPTTENGQFTGDLLPGRTDLVTGAYFDGGAANSYQKVNRYKPQFNVSLMYSREGWLGSHEFKTGYEIKRDRRTRFNDQPFDIFYRDSGASVSEVDLYNTPVDAINDVNIQTAYIQDAWKMGRRLTVNLGVRVDRYRDGWPDQSFDPNGIAALAGDPRIGTFYDPKSVDAKTVASTTTIGPRAGVAFDLRGNGKSVVKAYYGRFYFNSADVIADQENPVGRAQLRFEFLDLNGNRVVDSPQELGRLLSTVGGAGFVKVDPDIDRPYGEEVSAHFEHQLAEAVSGRVSYIYKNMRNEWAEVDLARVNAYTIPFATTDPGPDGRTGTGDDQTLELLDRPANAGTERTFTNPDPRYDSDYRTLELAITKRMSDRWMALSSFSYTWLEQFNGSSSSSSITDAVGLSKSYDWRPNFRRFGRESTSFYSFRATGRYVLPADVGVSGSYRLQSGQQYGRTLAVRLPGAGTETIRVEPADAHRAPNVGMIDLRFDKAFKFGGQTRLTGMVDIFNVTNNSVVTNFRITTGPTYQEIISLLGPRAVRLGVRFEF